MMRKKLLACLLAAVMAVTTIPVTTVQASEVPAGTAAVNETGDGAVADTEVTTESQEEEEIPDAENSSEIVSESEPESEKRTESESESEKRTESESESGTNPEDESESGTTSESDMETETGTEDLTETETETETESETEEETGSGEEIKIVFEEDFDEYPNAVIPFEIGGKDIFAGLRGGAFYDNGISVSASKYDPREENPSEMTSVKDQNPWGTCWSFAMMETLQSSMIRQGLANNSIDLSERHLAYFVFNSGYDALDNANDDTVVSTPEDAYLTKGGNSFRAATRLMNWNAGASESDYPYSNEYTVPGDLNAQQDAQNKAVIAHDIYFVPTAESNTEERKSAVKQLIQRFGSVEWSYYSADAFYSADYDAFYCDQAYGTNHAITIVGWDDDFPRTRFNSSCQPENNGAWIVKNSWGDWFGENGYFYISYEDKTLGSRNPASVSVAAAKDEYDNNYFHGNTSYTGRCIIGDDIKVAQIFEAKGSLGKERLTAVSMMLYGDNTDYSIQIYKNPELSDEGVVENPESGAPMLSNPCTGKTGYAGLYTIDLPTSVMFSKGDLMAVVIELKNCGSIYIDGTYTEQSPNYAGEGNYVTTYTNTTHSGQSMYNGGDGYGWYDPANEEESYNFRINALTKNVDPDLCLVRFLDSDGNLIEEKEAKKGTSITIPKAPEREGYEFTGWEDEDGNRFEGTVTGDNVFTAQYDLISYTITYELDGGINDENNPASYTIESDTIILKDPHKEDYVFMGWLYIDSDTQSEYTVTEIPTGSTGDITLRAQWGKEGLDLAEPRFQPASGIVEEGMKISIRSINPDADIYYTLDGSEPTPENGTKYTGSFELPTDTDTDTPIGLKAVAVRGSETSTVGTAEYTYKKVRLILKEEKITVKVGKTYAVGIGQLPTGKSESDVSWTSSNVQIATVTDRGEVTAVTSGTVTITAQTEDYKGRTVYAACEVTVGLPTYTVTFYDTDGNQIGEQQIVEEGRDAVPPQAPERLGYQFRGWSGSYTNVRRNLSLTAEYDLAVYKITYELNGGDPVEGNPTEYTIETETIYLKEPVKSESFFRGWFADKACEKDAVTEITKGSTGDLTLYAKWFTPGGLWMTDITPQTYTGSAVKPVDFIVYDATEPLTAGVDYTVSYKNNVKAYEYDPTQETSAKNAPTIVVKGKGNYSGTVTQCFTIQPIDIKDNPEIQADDITVAYKVGKNQTPSPVVQWGTKKLKAKADYVVEAPSGCAEPGSYEVQVKGIGNFTGERTITFTIASNDQKPIGSVKVSGIKDQTYTGKAITITEDMLKLKDGSYELKRGTDYLLDSGKYIDAGTYSVIVRGKGTKYVGMRRITFKIKGTEIKTAKVDSWGKTEFVYTGKEQKPKPVLKTKSGILKENKDYTIVKYDNNVDAGTAKVTVSGKGAYSGTAAFSFRIKPANAAALTVAFASGSSRQPYEKGGVKPKVTVSFNGQLISEDLDYKVSYKNNTAYPQKTGKDPQVVVTGKKNFTGSKTQTFTIIQKALSDIGMTFAPDIEENKKSGKFYSTPQLYDTNGNKLSAGTDYEKVMVYKNKSGKVLEKTDRPLANSEITVEITGKGAYTGTHKCTYRILASKVSVAKAKVKLLKKFSYTGEEIALTKQDIEVTLNGKSLTFGTNYKIVPYPNNPKKGKLRFLLKGEKQYGGTKTITVTVSPQGMKWWN